MRSTLTDCKNGKCLSESLDVREDVHARHGRSARNATHQHRSNRVDAKHAISAPHERMGGRLRRSESVTPKQAPSFPLGSCVHRARAGYAEAPQGFAGGVEER